MSLSILAERVGAALVASGHKLVTAESCTGGWVAQCITSVAGSSAWFERGFVTYSNLSKQELLGVPQETLKQWGAVSEETVREMAMGALRHSAAQCALAVTGIAGPAGGTPAKPVGTVWFAWQRIGEVCLTRRERFEGDRRAVRRQAVRVALLGMLNVYR